MIPRRLRQSVPRLAAWENGYDLGYKHGGWDERARRNAKAV